MTSRDSPPDQDLASSYFCDSPQGFGVVECGPLRAQARPRSVRGRRASRALRRRPEVMFFAPFIRRAPTARLCQVAIARGALSVRHRARGQVEDGGRRVPHSSQPDDLLSARTPSPAAHPRHERRPRLHPSLQPRSHPRHRRLAPPDGARDAGHRGGRLPPPGRRALRVPLLLADRDGFSPPVHRCSMIMTQLRPRAGSARLWSKERHPPAGGRCRCKACRAL